MSTRIESVHRRLLPLTVAAYLLAAAVSQLTAGSAAAGPDAGRGQIQTAGVNVGLGFHGYWGPYRPYYRPFYRPYYGLYPYAYPYLVYHGDYVIPRYASRFARLDLNVRPKKTTQVFVDGQYVGLSGQFDGWPEYLWLEASRRPAAAGRNTYELIFYNPGYKTVVRQLDVQPGALIKVREEMQHGE